jgi:hypothetical protein
VLELALKSDELHLASENDAYALVGGWLATQDGLDDQHDLLDRLVRCLRLHHMSPAFLTSVVARSEFRLGCPYLMEACTNALLYQSISASLFRLDQSERADYLSSGKADRARGASRYSFKLQLKLTDCQKLQAGGVISTRLGVAAGYHVRLDAKRASREGGDSSLGFFFHVCRPNVITRAAGEGATIGFKGPMVDVRIKAFDTEKDMIGLFSEETGWGFADFFDNTWDAVVRDYSDYFPRGRVTVKVRATFISDKHEEGSEPPSDEDEEDEEEE